MTTVAAVRRHCRAPLACMHVYHQAVACMHGHRAHTRGPFRPVSAQQAPNLPPRHALPALVCSVRRVAVRTASAVALPYPWLPAAHAIGSAHQLGVPSPLHARLLRAGAAVCLLGCAVCLSSSPAACPCPAVMCCCQRQLCDLLVCGSLQVGMSVCTSNAWRGTEAP